jgi:hypothetical protein
VLRLGERGADELVDDRAPVLAAVAEDLGIDVEVLSLDEVARLRARCERSYGYR